jgi:hypothetical protein
MPRTRSKGSSYEVTGSYGQVDDTGNYIDVPSSITTTVLNLDEMTDTVTPNFRRKSRAGSVIVSPMTKIYTHTRYVPTGKYWSHDGGSGEGGEGTNWVLISKPVDPRYPGGFLNHQDILDAIAQAEHVSVTAAYADVGKSDAESLVSLGELHETLAFLASPLKKVAQLSERFKRHHKTLERDAEIFSKRLERWSSLPPGRRSKIPKPVQPKRKLNLGKFEASDIAGLWLAYRYGLMPLVYDIQDHWKAFQNLANKPPERATARGKFTLKGSVVYPPEPGGSAGLSSWTTEELLDFQVSSRAGVLYEPRLETASQKFGLELHRIPSALWEWIPLSFVADWLLNMSEVLDALSSHLRAKAILGAWVTTRVDFSYQKRFFYTHIAPSGVDSNGTFNLDGFTVNRRPTSLADIALTTRISLNNKRIADAFSLAYLAVKSSLTRKR